jgi:ankyrin repeat protein
MKNRVFFSTLLLSSLIVGSIIGMQLGSQAKTDFLRYARINDIEGIRKILNTENVNINTHDIYFGISDEAGNAYSGMNALMWAAYHGNFELIKLLLKAGARVDLRNAQGLTAQEIALARGYDNIANYIQEKITLRSLSELTRQKALETEEGKEFLEEMEQVFPK